MKKPALLIFLLATLRLGAQNETNHWFWGMGMGLDFSTGTPVIETGSPVMWCNEGSAAISDRITGDLLFYTDGMVVFDATHMPMPNGYGLTGNTSSSQSALIVPMPRSSSLYYVFTNDCFECGTGYGFRYSVVDMSLNGGLGDVVAGSKNILLFSNNSEQLSAVRHANCSDWWIMAKEAHNNVYRAYLLTSSGITGPVVSSVGYPVSAFSAGQAKFSPDGSRYAISTACDAVPYNKGICQLFDFDNNTGLLSNAITLVDSTWAENTYGLAFSPDNSKLYVMRNLNGNYLYQYDLSSGVPATMVGSATFLGIHGAAQLQLAKNGKIYIAASWLGTGFSVINNPNVAGTACGYGPTALTSIYQAGICNFADSYLTSPCPLSLGASVYTGSLPACHGDTGGTAWITNVYNNVGPYTVSWSPGGYTTDTVDNLGAGTYTVTVTDSSGQVFIDTVIIAEPMPLLADIGTAPAVICQGTTAVLGATATGGTGPYQYNWSTGDTAALAEATLAASGYVSVTVTDTNGCSDSDFVYIAVLPAPALLPLSDTCICAGQHLVLTASGATAPVWSTGQNTVSIEVTPLTDTVFGVSITSPCVFSDSIAVCVHPLPGLTTAEAVTITYPETTVLNAQGEGSFEWSPAHGLSCTACAMPVAAPVNTTLYTVTLTDTNGCSSTSSITVTVLYDIEIPNIITPNGDGINDVFSIRGLPQGSVLRIFNRWGSCVLTSSAYGNDWAAPVDGVYYYALETPDGKSFSGFVQVTSR